jgi:protein-tyrosine-phosphatase
VQVDWSRFHLQILFVDREDMGSARIAHGLFDNIAAWNGFGRSMYSNTCGTQVAEVSAAPETSVSLMMRAQSLGTSVKTFSRAPEQLEMTDLYTYDIVVATTKAAESETLHLFEEDLRADWDSPNDRQYYRQRVCNLSDFLRYLSDEQITKRGGSSLMPRSMADLIESEKERLRSFDDIPDAPLSSVPEWNDMVRVITMGTAGLAQYLIDSFPEDLEYFWLE